MSSHDRICLKLTLISNRITFLFDRNQNWNYLHNSEVEGNTGFYWVKAKNSTIKLFEESIAIAPQYAYFYFSYISLAVDSVHFFLF